jgi:hypothetical protein
MSGAAPDAARRSAGVQVQDPPIELSDAPIDTARCTVLMCALILLSRSSCCLGHATFRLPPDRNRTRPTLRLASGKYLCHMCLEIRVRMNLPLNQITQRGNRLPPECNSTLPPKTVHCITCPLEMPSQSGQTVVDMLRQSLD